MASDIRDLYEWYPFLPWTIEATQYNEVLKHVLDIHLVIELPPGARVIGTGIVPRSSLPSRNVQAFRAYVTRITGTVADFSIRMADGQEDTIIMTDVPVFTDRDAVPLTNQCYVVTDQSISWSSDTGGAVVVHPNALVFLQRIMSLTLMQRVSDDVAWDVDHEEETPCIGCTVPNDAFVDGYNTTVTMSGDTLTFYAGAGVGRGIWKTPPYSNIDEYVPWDFDGLRSINGQTGMVGIQAQAPVTITETSSDHGIGLHLAAEYADET